MKTNIIQLYFHTVDVATGNIIYRGTDNRHYGSVKGTIHYVTGEWETLGPVDPDKVEVCRGHPVYDPNDPFARRLLGY